MSEILVAYTRGGGRPPADDERLEVADDGTLTAVRTVAGTRVGSFGGPMASRHRAAVIRAVDACRTTSAPWLPTPRDGATEQIGIGPDGEPMVELGAGVALTGPWGTLARRLRDLLELVTSQPVAAVELVADGQGARLVAAGPLSLEVDAGTVQVNLVHLDASGVPVARWSPAPGGDPGAAPNWQRTGPGWVLELPFQPGVTLAPGEWLQVWVRVVVRADAPRLARLFAAVPGPGA